ncbi:MAG: GAF domain-containing sensor histidine kinase, partial [Candidatus Promineifilaceae bacterium]
TIHDELLEEMVAQVMPVIVEDIRKDPRFENSGLPVNAASFAGTAMRARHSVLGVIGLFSDKTQTLPSNRSRLFTSSANQLAIAVDNAALRRQAEQFAALKERERLARELHDSATQSLFSLTLFAAAAREKIDKGQAALASQYLDDIRYTANQAHREMRLMLYELDTTESFSEGLAEALQRRLRAVEGRSGIRAMLYNRATVPLVGTLARTLYQIATEALNNALKHAGGSNIFVELSNDEDAVSLVIGDDGTGFDSDSVSERSGRGLKNMRARIAQLGGRLTIESSPENGTVIHAVLPLSRGK